jgi:hypothetical protein
LARSQARVTKPTVKGGLAPADAVDVKGRVFRAKARGFPGLSSIGSMPYQSREFLAGHSLQNGLCPDGCSPSLSMTAQWTGRQAAFRMRFWPHVAERCADQDEKEHVVLQLGCGMHRGVIWPVLISGLAISGLSDTGVSPGRRFQPLIVGLAMAIWALTHFAGHDSRDPPGLTLAHQPAHSDHTPMQPLAR